MPTFCNNLARTDVVIGIVYAIDVSDASRPSLLTLLHSELYERVGYFSANYESRRKAVRDILRNGSYKPSGRGKPASEYLASLVLSETPLPEINPLVDIFNYISARYQFPISVWSPDQINAEAHYFDLGRSNDQYVFNASGHTIAVKDLITGYVQRDGDREAVLSPVKDAHVAKVSVPATDLAAAFYIPTSELNEVDDIFECAANLLRLAAPRCSSTTAKIAGGHTVDLEPNRLSNVGASS